MRNRKGFTLIELMIVVSIIGILALIAIPNFQNLRQKAHNASALSAGRNAKLAQEVIFQDDETAMYANDLVPLLSVDGNLVDDDEVTFTFGNCNTSGYTYTTTHLLGNQTYVFTN